MLFESDADEQLQRSRDDYFHFRYQQKSKKDETATTADEPEVETASSIWRRGKYNRMSELG